MFVCVWGGVCLPEEVIVVFVAIKVSDGFGGHIQGAHLVKDLQDVAQHTTMLLLLLLGLVDRDGGEGAVWVGSYTHLSKSSKCLTE